MFDLEIEENFSEIENTKDEAVMTDEELDLMMDNLEDYE